MTGQLNYGRRVAMMTEVAGLSQPLVFTGDVAVPGVPYVAEGNYEVALLSAGVEISGNAYARASLPIGSTHLASWSRSSTTCTVTTSRPHNLPAGTTTITIPVTDDYDAVPADDYLCTRTSSTTFEFTCPAAGGTSGSLAMIPPSPFWLVDGTDPEVYLTQLVDIVFAAASGGNWDFDELRLITSGASGGYELSFMATTPITVIDGNTLTIAAGTLVVNDLSPTLV